MRILSASSSEKDHCGCSCATDLLSPLLNKSHQIVDKVTTFRKQSYVLTVCIESTIYKM